MLAPAIAASGVEGILAQQLAVLQTVMQQQMELLSGGALAIPAQPAVPQAPAAQEPVSLAPQAGNGRHADAPAGSGTRGVAAATEGMVPASVSAPAPAPAPVKAAIPAKAAEAADDRLAVHGPHRPVRQTLGQGGGFSERQERHFDELVRSYNARTRRSKEYAAENRPWLSDNRAALGFRMATKEMLYPVVGERSEGSRIWDVDGNEYIDFTNGFGAHFFGHRPPFVIQAVEEQLRRGHHIGPQSDLAGPAARLLRELAGVERTTFCNTGSEAMMTAVRIARASTGRDRIVMFEGSYHGCFDGVLARRGRDGRSLPVAPGTPRKMVDDVVILTYGAPEALEWIRANGHDVAAVLVEPIQSRNPEFHPREFLRELRGICDGTGAVLVFDEMITGLRLGARGAQEFLGVDADLVTYGKVIGGGFPMGVVAGKARYMDAIDGGQWSFGDDSFPEADQTFFAGTFCKHPVPMAAATAVLRHLQERGPALYDDINGRAARLVAALRGVIAEEGAQGVRLVHCGSCFSFRVDGGLPWADLLFYHLLQRGMYIWEQRACYLSTAHTDEDCERLVAAFRDSLHALREGGFLPEAPASGGGAPSSGAGGRGDLSAPADGGALPITTGSAEAPALLPDLKLYPPLGEPERDVVSFPLTPAQRQVWVHAQLGEDASRAYHEQATLGLRGPL
ncbi:MAG TPA: aminotransferase class III-fold pyridoxal phosphate-dependent enzyme, partial [Longimicrobiaceae bacterium]